MSKNLSLDRMPAVDLESLRGWERLKPTEQTTVRRETDELLRTFQVAGKARLAIGEHLAHIRDVLEPKKLFERFLRVEGIDIFKISRATAYRYIQTYEAARTILPAPVMQLALMRPNDSLDLDMVRSHPAPRTSDPEKINAYLDKVSRTARAGKIEDDPETLKKECINFIRTRYERLPPGMTSRQRHAWMQHVREMTLALEGVAGPITLKAAAIPDGFKPNPVGRPPLTRKGPGSSPAPN